MGKLEQRKLKEINFINLFGLLGEKKTVNERWRNFFSVKLEKENKFYKFIRLRGEENNFLWFYMV